MSDHSPAPWKVDTHKNGKGFSIRDAEKRCVAKISTSMPQPPEEKTENATLMASAPSLLRVIETFAADVEDEFLDDDGNWIEPTPLVIKVNYPFAVSAIAWARGCDGDDYDT